MKKNITVITGAMPFTAFIAVAMAGTVLGGCVDREAQVKSKQTAALVTNPVQTVSVQPAAEVTLTQDLEVTGDVTTSADTQISAKTAGRIVSVNVKDGDYVQTGEVLVTQDTTPVQAQLNQANAGVLTAMAGLAQAQSQLTQALRNATIGPYRSSSAVMSAEAGLRSAKSNLDKMVSGARPQERLQADATLNSAKANLDVAKKQLDRIKVLVEQGALAGSQLDSQLAAYETALATYQSAEQSVSLIKQGNRTEDIEAAREQVAQAQEALKTAQASKDLDPLLQDQVQAARAAVASSKATIDNAKAQVVIAKQALQDAVLRAPFSGQISGKPVEVGSLAVPGTPVVRVIGHQGIYFEGNVPSEGIGKVKVGMPVSIQVASSKVGSHDGQVAAISPLGSSVARLFTIRVQFNGAPGDVLPGMFATGDIRVITVPNATVVPANAVIARDNQTFVFLAENGKAKRTPVTVGLHKEDKVQVTGIAPGSPVIVAGQDRLSDGASIIAEKLAGATPPSSPSAMRSGKNEPKKTGHNPAKTAIG